MVLHVAAGGRLIRPKVETVLSYRTGSIQEYERYIQTAQPENPLETQAQMLSALSTSPMTLKNSPKPREFPGKSRARELRGWPG